MARINWIRGLGGLFGGNYDLAGQFMNVLGHPTHGTAAASVAASVATIESNPAAAPAIVNGLLQQPGVTNIPGVVAALEAIVAASNPFNVTAFNAAVTQLETALEGATAVVDTVGTASPGWHGWGTRLVNHLRTGPGHADTRRR